MARMRPFKQLDVFTPAPYLGNPLAVVLDGEGLSDEQMQQFARWTNLSETTFLLPPTQASADYRVRIFTTSGELPFAGHPTLGSCHAWLEAGGQPRSAEAIVQECKAGLITIKRAGAQLMFGAPPLLKTGPVAEDTLAAIAACLKVPRADIQHHQWVDNGPGWMAVMLRSAEQVLSLKPDFSTMAPIKLGLVGAYPGGSAQMFEIRAFFTTTHTLEDPVTGSLNAGVAQWLMGAGLAPARYSASQGRAIGRAGQIELTRDSSGQVWVGGQSITCVDGSVRL